MPKLYEYREQIHAHRVCVVDLLNNHIFLLFTTVKYRPKFNMNDEGEFPLGCQLWLEGLVMLLQIAVPAHILLYTTCTIGPAPLFARGTLGFAVLLLNLLEFASSAVADASKNRLGLELMTKHSSIDPSTCYLPGNISYTNSVLHHLNSKFLSENQLCYGFGEASGPCGGLVCVQ